MIYCKDVGKTYGEVKALQHIDLIIKDNELVALLGPNGSGKSTLFRSLMGIHEYDGVISVNGLDPLANGKAVRRAIGYMPQQSGLHHDLTLQETMSFYSQLRGVNDERSLELLEKLRLVHKLHSKVGELSGGMRQRLSFGVALLGDPAILLLDEPTASLDVESQGLMIEWLKELHANGKTVVISTHSRYDVIELAERSVTLEQGKIVRDVILPASTSTIVSSSAR